MTDRTIYITGGNSVATSRLLVKNALECFGQIELCNMGLRAKLNDPTQAPPVIRFATREGAQKAMDAIKRGQIVIVGLVIQAEWKKDEDMRMQNARSNRGITNLSSRDIVNTRSSYRRGDSRDRGRGDRGRGGGEAGDRGGDRYGDRGRRDSRDRGRSPRRNASQTQYMVPDLDRAPPAGYQAPVRNDAAPPSYTGVLSMAPNATSASAAPAAVEDAPPTASQGSFTHCGSGHSLEEFTIETPNMEYECDICATLSATVGEQLMVCLGCDYFVCETCTDSYHGVLG